MLIRVVDLETTGFEPPEAGVCEIGYCDLLATRLDLTEEPAGWTVLDGAAEFVHPGHPITPASSAVHHIVDEDVASAKPWPEVARWYVGPDAITPMVAGVEAPIAVYAAHSANFERLFIGEELTGGLPWICTYKCALRLWPDAPLHSNQGLRYWRRPPGLRRDVASLAHRAYPDAYVTAHHLRDMLDLAPLADLIRWSAEPALQVRCGFGRDTRGMRWTEVSWSFLHWVAQRDFEEDVLFTVRHEMERRRKVEEAERAARQDDDEDGIPF